MVSRIFSYASQKGLNEYRPIFRQAPVVVLQEQQSKSSRSDFKKNFQPSLIIMLK